jgi:DNA polymerase I-like protein with 3'-5' exonuclease and polymerase domains
MLSSNVVLTEDHLHTVLEHFMERDAFAFDVEAQGENRGIPHLANLSWLSMATQGMAVSIPFGHPNGSVLVQKARRKKNKFTNTFDMFPAVYDDPPEQLSASTVFDTLRPLFVSDRVKIAQNATYDLVSTAKYNGGKPFPGPYEDTIVMQWLLDENLKQKGLKDMTRRYYGVDYDKVDVGKCVEAHPFNLVAHYSYMDAKYTWLLRQRFKPLIESHGLDEIFALEMGVLRVLLDMNLVGAPVDVSTMRELEADLSTRLVDIEGRIYKAAGQRFNINSNPQKQKVLFGAKTEGGQGLKPHKFTDTGAPSTDAESLENYPNNPVVQALVEYQDISKLLTTYLQSYLGVEGNKKKPSQIYNGRIHADFVQYGTVTGRFSCREPNLQNIPRPDTELGNKIRGLFVAPPGHQLVVADYGQIELVVLAHYSRAKALVDGFNDGIDAHTMTASKVFGVPFDQVTKEMRQVAKGINFAVVYGAGPDKVAAMSGVSLKEAKRFLEIHQKEFPEIYKFKDQVIKTALTRKPPRIRTLMGRYRRLPTLYARDFKVRGAAERQAVNSLIQGSAADIIKLAMVRLHDSLPEDMSLILSVHDELVVICPEGRTEVGVELVREAMLGDGITKWLSVPMTSDVKVVDRWSQAK